MGDQLLFGATHKQKQDQSSTAGPQQLSAFQALARYLTEATNQGPFGFRDYAAGGFRPRETPKIVLDPLQAKVFDPYGVDPNITAMIRTPTTPDNVWNWGNGQMMTRLPNQQFAVWGGPDVGAVPNPNFAPNRRPGAPPPQPRYLPPTYAQPQGNPLFSPNGAHIGYTRA